MKDRIAQIIEKEHLSPARFADMVNVQRSSVSHVLSGRNKPSMDFIQKLISAFPHLNSEWLITGQGAMYKTEARPSSLFDLEEGSSNEIAGEEPVKRNDAFPVFNFNTEKEKPQKSSVFHESLQEERSGRRKIEKIVVFYSDNSFEEFHPFG